MKKGNFCNPWERQGTIALNGKFFLLLTLQKCMQKLTALSCTVPQTYRFPRRQRNKNAFRGEATRCRKKNSGKKFSASEKPQFRRKVDNIWREKNVISKLIPRMHEAKWLQNIVKSEKPNSSLKSSFEKGTTLSGLASRRQGTYFLVNLY